MISLMLFLDIYVYNHLLNLGAKSKGKFFLINLDLAKILLLNLREIGKENLKILVFPFKYLSIPKIDIE